MLQCLILHKLCFFLFSLLVVALIPMLDTQMFDRAMRWPAEGKLTYQSRYATWDAAHYLHIAEQGYAPGSPSCAFYPLWPFLIRTCAPVFGGSLFWTGIILSNLLSLAGFFLFYRLSY